MDQNNESKTPVIEVYPCLQSEGKLTGIPHICIRTTGCPMRCQFGENDFCDSWYTSWHPEKASFTEMDIMKVLEANSHIKHVFITGGSPTMHGEFLQRITKLLHSLGYFITLETEGSKFVEGCWIDLVSLSPKFSNSNPIVGSKTPQNRTVTHRELSRHEKYRKNYDAMSRWISSSPDYQFKPVMNEIEDWIEIEKLVQILDIPNEKIWIMPAGGSEDELQKRRKNIMEFCWMIGVNYTDRMHITAYGAKRGV